jgi:hypothetical protein
MRLLVNGTHLHIQHGNVQPGKMLLFAADCNPEKIRPFEHFAINVRRVIESTVVSADTL